MASPIYLVEDNLFELTHSWDSESLDLEQKQTVTQNIEMKIAFRINELDMLNGSYERVTIVRFFFLLFSNASQTS